IIFYTTWESVAYHDWEQQDAQGQIVFSNLDAEDPVFNELIRTNCTSCHGGELAGGSGPNLVEPELDAATVEAFVRNGVGDEMPAFEDQLTDDEIVAISEFVADLEEVSKSATNSEIDRKSTRLNSSHVSISYAVFCLKKKNTVLSKMKEKKVNKT